MNKMLQTRKAIIEAVNEGKEFVKLPSGVEIDLHYFDGVAHISGMTGAHYVCRSAGFDPRLNDEDGFYWDRAVEAHKLLSALDSYATREA